MDREKIKKIIEKKFKNIATKELFYKQIDNFFKYHENNTKLYKVGEEVQLSTTNLIHGSRIEPENMSIIKQHGLVASEFYLKKRIIKKKPFIVEFWNVENEMTLKEFIDTRAGVTIEVNNMDGTTKYQIMSSINDIGTKIQALSSYRDYVIYQNQEQRFIPNKYFKDSTIAFIIDNDSEKKNDILKNDIFNKKLDRTILEEILPKWYIEKYIDGQFDIHETGREKGILFGVPSEMIEGILVNDEIKSNTQILNHIHHTFPNCYICDTNGKVLIGNF